MDFLKAITVREAFELIRNFPISKPETEMTGLDDVQGRVLARDIVSDYAIPPYARSLVDGYAVKTKDAQGARETAPVLLNLKGEVKIGERTGKTLLEGDTVYVATGSMVPDGCDAVVMQEHARPTTDVVEITKAVHRGENICYEGEDIARGVAILKKGQRVRTFDRGIMAALGVSAIEVYKVPRIGLISSGDEIVGINEDVPPGKIRDINRYTVSGLLKNAGGDARFLGLCKDSIEDITAKLSSAGDCSMILVSGGSSKGERDFITASIERLGGTILFHGVNIKPGKPAIFGQLFEKPVFGLPGHPASCIMVTVKFVLPLLRRLEGEEHLREITVPALMATNVPSVYGIEEYVRVTIEKDGENRYCARPVFSKSAVIAPLAKADGYIVVPDNAEGIEKGEPVEVCLFP